MNPQWTLPTSRRYQQYLKSIQWRTLRAARLELDNWHCITCGQQLKPKTAWVRHIIFDNLYHESIGDVRSLCWDCFDAIYVTDDMTEIFGETAIAFDLKNEILKYKRQKTIRQRWLMEWHKAYNHITTQLF